MATSLDADRVVAVVSQLYNDLHPRTAGHAIGLGSRLDRDLGLDSVSRIELLERLERALSRRFEEGVVLRAQTVAELLEALSVVRDSPHDERDRAPPPIVQPSGPLERIDESIENLAQVLAFHARVHPERVHAEFLGDGDVKVLRYGELYESALQIAAGLSMRGVERGDRVALMLPTGTDYLRCFSAVVLLGAIPVPLYPPARPELLEEHMARQQRILENAQAVALITTPAARSLVLAIRGKLGTLRLITDRQSLVGDESLTPRHPSGQEPALLQYTSGSTGDPKGVVLSHRNVLANIRAMGRAIEVTSEDLMISWLPLYHDMGLIGGWLAGLYFGFPVVLMSPEHFLTKPARWLRAISEAGGTLSCAPNFAYELCVRRVLDEDLVGVDLSRWRFALNGSEPVSAHTVEAFCARFATHGFRRSAMSPAYGLAECSVALAFPPLMRGPRIDRVQRAALVRSDRAVPAQDEREGIISLVACGHALTGHELRVVDALGYECADRAVGEIEFRGPSATSGYFRRPDETRALFHGDWLRSGDLGYIAEGDLFVTGRRKDMIIRAGQHIFPQELEEAVGDLPGVRKGCVAAFAVHDAQARTDQLVIAAETRLTEQAARAELSARIAECLEVLLGTPPEVVLLLPPLSVPKTSSGKLRRSLCRQAYEQGTLGAARHPAAQRMRMHTHAALARCTEGARSFRVLAYGSYAWLCFALVAVVAWLFVLVLPRRRWRLATARAAARTLGWLTFTPWSVRNSEHLPEGGAVIVANHQSNIDPFVLVAALPVELKIVAKSELSHHWWTRVPLDRLGIHFVERSVASEGIADARRIIEDARAGRTLLFFPEGTHARMPGLPPFHMGAFLTAARASLPVVPVALLGTRSILRSDTWLPRRGTIEVRIGRALVADGPDFEAALRLSRATRSFLLEQTGEPDLG